MEPQKTSREPVNFDNFVSKLYELDREKLEWNEVDFHKTYPKDEKLKALANTCYKYIIETKETKKKVYYSSSLFDEIEASTPDDKHRLIGIKNLGSQFIKNEPDCVEGRVFIIVSRTMQFFKVKE